METIGLAQIKSNVQKTGVHLSVKAKSENSGRDMERWGFAGRNVRGKIKNDTPLNKKTHCIKYVAGFNLNQTFAFRFKYYPFLVQHIDSSHLKSQ